MTRIGVDLGGTKIEIVVLDASDRTVFRRRIAAPRTSVSATVDAIAALIASAEAEIPSARRSTIGLAMPGSISPVTGRTQNSNSTVLNGTSFVEELSKATGRSVSAANDADCFALSESRDGAGRGAYSVFGAILGTGCGGAMTIEGRLIRGRHGIVGEWGHVPLPWLRPDEIDGPMCWCGRRNCLETRISGTAIERDYGESVSAKEVAERAQSGETLAQRVMEDYFDRLARALTMIVTIFDPEVIVLGGGVSNLSSLYETLPSRIAPRMFADHCRVSIVPPLHGDASGARGAARLVSK